jgi:hypothetical protein
MLALCRQFKKQRRAVVGILLTVCASGDSARYGIAVGLSRRHMLIKTRGAALHIHESCPMSISVCVKSLSSSAQPGQTASDVPACAHCPAVTAADGLLFALLMTSEVVEFTRGFAVVSLRHCMLCISYQQVDSDDGSVAASCQGMLIITGYYWITGFVRHNQAACATRSACHAVGSAHMVWVIVGLGTAHSLNLDPGY